MIHLSLNIRYSRRALPALGMICLLALAALVTLVVPSSALEPPGSLAVPVPSERTVFLTDRLFEGRDALDACGPGYRLAALWEIRDPSTWRYAYDHASALTLGDSGQGPPSGSYGWVRTGGAASVTDTPGVGNCNAWRPRFGTASGTAIRLPSDWSLGNAIIRPWQAKAQDCATPARVWCISSVNMVYLPLVMR